MFSRPEIERAIDLHERSYALLVWMSEAIEKGFIRFEAAHSYASLPEAALAWLERHHNDLPRAARPALEELKAFANLFSTFLESSFDLVEEPGKRLYSPDAHCFCPMCSWLVDLPHLRPKKLSKADKERARALELDAVRALAAEASLALSADVAARIAGDSSLREPLARTAWARALARRLEGHSEGPATLALWRGFAWTAQGSPKRDFALRVVDFLEAQDALLERVRAEAQLE